MGRTGRAVLLVAGGTVLAQLIGAAVTPLLTRIYGPESLGVLAAVLAYAGVIGPVAGLCLPIAIVIAQDPTDRADLSRAARTIAVASGLLAAALIPLFLQDVHAAGVPWVITGLVVAALIASSVSVQVVQQRIIAVQEFRLLGALLVGQAVLFAMAQLGAGVLWPHPSLLVAVSGLYSLLFLGIAWSTPRYRRVASGGKPASTIRATVRRWQDFPKYRAPQVFMSAVGIHLPTLLLAALVDIRWAGLFMVTHRILALPVIFIGKAISDVIYPQVVEVTKQGLSAFGLLRRWTLTAVAVSIPLVLVILLAGQTLFPLLLGREWAQAGLLAQALTPWMLGALLSRPAVGAVPVLGLQRHYLVVDAIIVIARSAVLAWMLARGFDVWLALLVWSVLSAASALWITVASLRRSRQTPHVAPPSVVP